MSKLKEKQKIDQFEKELDAYKQTTQDQRSSWENWHQFFAGNLDESPYPWMSRRFIHRLSADVNTITPFIFGQEPTLVLHPVGPEDRASSRVVQDFLQHQFNNTMDAYEKLVPFVRQGVLYGTSFMLLRWELEKDENGKVVKNDPCLEPLNIFNVYANPLISDIDKQHAIIYKTWKTKDELMRYKGAEDKVKKLKAGDASGSGDTGDSTGLDATEFSNRESLYNDTDRFEVYERLSKDRIQTYVKNAESEGGYVLIRDVENLYGRIPVVSWKYEGRDIPNRLYGDGLGKTDYDIQDLQNELLNISIDQMTAALNKMFVVRRDANIDPYKLVWRPSGYIEVNDTDDIRELPTSDLKSSFFKMMGLVDDLGQKATGSTDIVKGLEGGSTATESEILDRNAGSRLDLARKALAKSIARMGEIILTMDRVHMEYEAKPRSVQIFNEDTKKYELLEVGIEDLDIDVDIVVQAESMVMQNPKLLREQLLKLLNIASKDERAGLNTRKVYQKIMELGGVLDADKYFEDAPGMPRDLELAQHENTLMMGGAELPSTPHASPEHTGSHEAYKNSAEYRQNATPQVQAMFEAHIEGELQEQLMAKQKQQGPPRQGFAPIPGQGPAQGGGSIPGLSQPGQLPSNQTEIQSNIQPR